MNLEIALINFAVSCPFPITAQRLTAAYGQFIKKIISTASDIHIDVQLKTGDMPDTSEMVKILDTGQSWSMFKKNNEYFLGLISPAHKNQVIWLAHFDPDFEKITIYCGDALIDRENGKTTVSSPLSYPLDQLLLMYLLAKREGALFHAAGMNLNGRGFIFPGRSGAGKSTLSRQFLNHKSIGMLSDDRVVIRKINGDFKLFGTPWAGDAGIAENKSFPLSRIFFINHSETNMIKDIKPKEAIERLMPVTSIPWYDEKKMSAILSFCEDLVFNVPAHELHFRPDSKVVDFLEKFVSA
jgi:hypothetical protein